MGLLTRIVTRIEKRFQTRNLNPADDRYYHPSVISSMTETGVEVTPENALRHSTVLACTRVLTEGFACLPVHVWRKEGKNRREKDTRHYLSRLLRIAPNRWQTSFEFRETMLLHILMSGNFYAQKLYSLDGSKVVELIPLDPARMAVIKEKSGTLTYKYVLLSGITVVLPQEEVLHVKGMSHDGITGMSLIKWAAEGIALGIGAEAYGARFFQNDATPGVILKHPAKLNDKAYANIQASWNEAHKGLKNAHKAAIVEEGMDVVRIGMSPADAQMLDTRRYQREDICGIFRVPLWLVQAIQNGGEQNLESKDTTFVRHSLMPWVKRTEAAFLCRLVEPQDQKTYYVEFNMDGLMRGDLESRYKAYAIGRQWGWLSPNRICDRENEEPIGDGGDTFLVPMNMVDSKYASELRPKPLGTNDGAQNNPNAPTNENQHQTASGEDYSTHDADIAALRSAYSVVLSEKLKALMTKEEKRLQSLVNRDNRQKAVEDFYHTHRDFMKESLLPLVNTYTELRHHYLNKQKGYETKSTHQLRLTALGATTSFCETYVEQGAKAPQGEMVPKDIIGSSASIMDTIDEALQI